MGICKYCGKSAGFLRSVHKSCRRINEKAKDEIVEQAKKAAAGQVDLGTFEGAVKQAASAAYIDDSMLKSLLILGWEKASSVALEDNLLTSEEEKSLEAFIKAFNLDQDSLDINGAYSNIIKASIIREVLDGKIPAKVQSDIQLPFNLQKDELIVWIFRGVPYYEQRTRIRYEGGYSGVSIRIAKGLYYRTGGFRGNPVATTNMVKIDNGILGVTNKHVYFAGGIKSFRIPYAKVVSFAPYSDGIGIQKDGVTAKPQIFITNDGWFTYNLISNLAQLGRD
jgi:hypothetical protein